MTPNGAAIVVADLLHLSPQGEDSSLTDRGHATLFLHRNAEDFEQRSCFPFKDRKTTSEWPTPLTCARRLSAAALEVMPPHFWRLISGCKSRSSIQRSISAACVFTYGCIPSKALLHASKLIEKSHQSKNWGIEFPNPNIDLARLRSWKDGVVKKITVGLGQLSRQHSIHYIQGRAAFENSNTLRIARMTGGEEQLLFDRIVIATGSRTAVVPSLNLDSPP